MVESVDLPWPVSKSKAVSFKMCFPFKCYQHFNTLRISKAETDKSQWHVFFNPDFMKLDQWEVEMVILESF